MNEASQVLVDSARACLGTPFYHQGRVAGIGLDCIGLVIHAVKQIGITVFDEQNYGREPQGDKLHAALLNHEFHLVEDIAAGDVLLFRFNGEPQHVGLAVTTNAMVHSYAPIGRVVETGLGETWTRRIAGIYRHLTLLQE
ncbi:MAG: C40 family peptidase [Alphaproteobacteria bacterium]|nr:C40 family peptidase [Alphaproteobacteria bacterium]